MYVFSVHCVCVPLLCDNTTFAEETQHICILTLDRSPRTDQSTGTATVQLGETMSFIWLTNRNTGERLLIGAEITQKQLPYPNPPQHR